MSNWQYAHDVPTAPFRGSMSLVRELSLRTTADARVELVQAPVLPERLESRSVGNIDVEVGLAGTVSLDPERAASVELCSGSDVLATVTLDVAAGEVFLDAHLVEVFACGGAAVLR